MDNPFELIESRLDNIEALLNELKQSKQAPEAPDPDRWMDLNELCKYLPEKPKPATIYKNIKDIPHHKGRKKLRFLKSEIDAWLKQGRRMTTDEIKNEADRYIDKNK